MHKLPYGPVSSLRRFDELYQLSYEHLSRVDRLDFVCELHSMPDGELLRHDRSHRRHCMPLWKLLLSRRPLSRVGHLCCGAVFIRFGNSMHGLLCWDGFRRSLVQWLHGLHTWHNFSLRKRLCVHAVPGWELLRIWCHCVFVV